MLLLRALNTSLGYKCKLAGGIQSSVACRGWVLKYVGAQQVLWIMSMAHPNQADRPQRSHHVSDGILAVNDLGIGSGWQQSKQNGARPAVVGQWARMKCSNLCCVQDVRLHPFYFIDCRRPYTVWHDANSLSLPRTTGLGQRDAMKRMTK